MALIIGTASLLLGCPDPVTEKLKSSNADLSALTVSEGNLTPAFAAYNTTYKVSVPYTTTNITVSCAAAESNAIVSGDNNMVKSLNVGTNTINITVTAENGTTTKDYVVKVIRYGNDYTSANIGTLKYVPIGQFKRDNTSIFAGDNSVISSAFRMSQYEITRAQFSTIMGTDPSNNIYSSGTSDPVQNLTWYHAIAFCNKLSLSEGLTPVYAVTGVDFNSLTYASIPTSGNPSWDLVTIDWNANGYRLPTEMEWMWAAMGAPLDGQGGSTDLFSYSKIFAGKNSSNNMADYAWYSSNSNNKSHPVGTKTSNELDLYDLSGNVWEFCWDWYSSYPTGILTDYRGPDPTSDRVMRGGCWDFGATGCGVAFRGSLYAGDKRIVCGFRVVRN